MITLWSFQALKLYFVSTHLKEILSENFRLQKAFQNLSFGLVRSTARSTAGRAELLCRLIGWSTDMHQCACVHIGRLSRSTGRRSRALCLFWSTGPIDRQRVFTLYLGTSVDRPVDRFPNGRKSDRWRSTGPVDRQ